MSVRGVPVQDLIENQDPDVLYVINEVTREITPIIVPAAEVVEEKPRRRKKNAEPAAAEEAPDGDAAEGEGE